MQMVCTGRRSSLGAAAAGTAPLVEVTTASGKSLGKVLRDVVGNKQSATGWSSYGSLMLGTQHGKVEIDYLDIVSVRRATSFVETKPAWLRRGRRGNNDGANRASHPSIRGHLP